jgi:hypothetical protein
MIKVLTTASAEKTLAPELTSASIAKLSHIEQL